MKFIHCKTRGEFFEVTGRDWVKIVKVCGGYIGFNSLQEFKTWSNQK